MAGPSSKDEHSNSGSIQDVCCVCGTLIWIPADGKQWYFPEGMYAACNNHSYKAVAQSLENNTDDIEINNKWR